MCMICSGLKNNKLSMDQAREKYEEFIELDLIDEEHQEEIELLFEEIENEEIYWNTAKKEYLRSRQEYDDEDFEDLEANEDFREDD